MVRYGTACPETDRQTCYKIFTKQEIAHLKAGGENFEHCHYATAKVSQVVHVLFENLPSRD
jgi:hypothetical protein